MKTKIFFSILIFTSLVFFILLFSGGCDDPFATAFFMDQLLQAEQGYQTSWALSSAPEQDIYTIRNLWNSGQNCIVSCNAYRWGCSGIFDECIIGPKTNFSASEPSVIVIRVADRIGKPIILKGSFQPMMSSFTSQALLGETRQFNGVLDTVKYQNYVHTFQIDVKGRGNFSFYVGDEYIGSVSVVKK